MRIGIKCLGVFFENQNLLSKNEPFLEKINTKSCHTIQKMMASSKEMNLWEAVKIALNLSQFEYNKIADIFENIEDIDLVFSNEICRDLSKNVKGIENLNLRKELLNVLFSN